VKLAAGRAVPGGEHDMIMLHVKTFAEALAHAKLLEVDHGVTSVDPLNDPAAIVD
jgi:hypothetical protein